MARKFVQVLSALAMVGGLTSALVHIARDHAHESNLSAGLLARDGRVVPLFEFEMPSRSVSGWESASVHIIVRNVGSSFAVIDSMALEFRAVNDDCPVISEPLPSDAFVLAPGYSREFDAAMPLGRIESKYRSGPNGLGRVVFQIRHSGRGGTGAEFGARSKQFGL